MFDAFSSDVALLALRVNDFLSSGGLHNLSMGSFFYDGWVLLAAALKWLFSLVGLKLSAVTIFQCLDIIGFAVGLIFLYRILIKRASVFSIFLVSLMLISAPGVLATASLGNGHGFVFMLLAMALSFIDDIYIDEEGSFLRKSARYIYLFILLIFFIRPRDGVSLLLPLAIFVGEKLGIFSWGRWKLFRAAIPVVFLLCFLILAFTYTNNISLDVLSAGIKGISPKWFFLPFPCLIFGLGFLSIGLYPFHKWRRYWMPAWLYLLIVVVASIIMHISFEFRFVFPVLVFLFPAVVESFDAVLRASKLWSKALLLALVSIVFLIGAKFTIDYMVYRYLNLNSSFVKKVDGKVKADFIIARDMGPLFKYYADTRVISPQDFMSPRQMYYFWQEIGMGVKDGRRYLYLSTVDLYQDRKLLDYLPWWLEADFLYSGYILDWHGCHGIIPTLQPVQVWFIKERKIDAEIPNPDKPQGKVSLS